MTYSFQALQPRGAQVSLGNFTLKSDESLARKFLMLGKGVEVLGMDEGGWSGRAEEGNWMAACREPVHTSPSLTLLIDACQGVFDLNGKNLTQRLDRNDDEVSDSNGNGACRMSQRVDIFQSPLLLFRTPPRLSPDFVSCSKVVLDDWVRWSAMNAEESRLGISRFKSGAVAVGWTPDRQLLLRCRCWGD